MSCGTALVPHPGRPSRPCTRTSAEPLLSQAPSARGDSTAVRETNDRGLGGPRAGRGRTGHGHSPGHSPSAQVRSVHEASTDWRGGWPVAETVEPADQTVGHSSCRRVRGSAHLGDRRTRCRGWACARPRSGWSAAGRQRPPVAAASDQAAVAGGEINGLCPTGGDRGLPQHAFQSRVAGTGAARCALARGLVVARNPPESRGPRLVQGPLKARHPSPGTSPRSTSHDAPGLPPANPGSAIRSPPRALGPV